MRIVSHAQVLIVGKHNRKFHAFHVDVRAIVKKICDFSYFLLSILYFILSKIHIRKKIKFTEKKQLISSGK